VSGRPQHRASVHCWRPLLSCRLWEQGAGRVDEPRVHHEAVGRPGVHQGDEGLVAHGHTQSHGLASGHAGECIEGDLDARVIYKDVPREVVTVHLEEVDQLLGALLEMTPREFLRAVEA
jgi:hypothetical protein